MLQASPEGQSVSWMHPTQAPCTVSQTGVVGVAAQSLFEPQNPVMYAQVFCAVQSWFIGQSAVVTHAAQVPDDRQCGVVPEQSESVLQPVAGVTQPPSEQLWPAAHCASVVQAPVMEDLGIQQESVPQTLDSHSLPLVHAISPDGQVAFEEHPAACAASRPPTITRTSTARREGTKA